MLRRNIAGITDAIDQGELIKYQQPIYDIAPVDIYDSSMDIAPPALPDYKDLPQLKEFYYTGKVVDAYGNAIPKASVLLLLDGKQVAGTAADPSGNFSIVTNTQVTSIVISSTGYIAWEWPASFDQHVFELQRDVKELPPVDIPVKKNNYSWLLLLLLIPLLKDKKKVGKIEMSTVLAIGAGLAIVLGFDTVVKILRELGIGKTKEGIDYEDQLSDPGSFWNPGFWKKGPAGTFILKNDAVIKINDQIINAFHWYNDDEAAVIAAFKQMKTQSQLSYFADWFQSYQGKDLLKWLKGADIFPDDRLSVAEIAEITNYFKQLPKYIP